MCISIYIYIYIYIYIGILYPRGAANLPAGGGDVRGERRWGFPGGRGLYSCGGDAASNSNSNSNSNNNNSNNTSSNNNTNSLIVMLVILVLVPVSPLSKVRWQG